MSLNKVFIPIMSMMFLFSCDAMIFMPYVVINNTKNPIKLDIKDHPKDLWSYSELCDTIVVLKPGEEITLKVSHAIGFPWETKKIYRANPGTDNFKLILNDSIVEPDRSPNKWTYNNKRSVYRISE